MFVHINLNKMKLIRNISPMGIKTGISVVKSDGQVITVELNHGDSILVDDNGVETKSIIIQKKKGNIEISEDFSSLMTPYKIHTKEQELNITVLELTFESDEDKLINEPEEAPAVIEAEIVNETEEAAPTEIELEFLFTESVKSKGGRPKGSDRKPMTKAQIKKKKREQYHFKKLQEKLENKK